MWSRPSQQDPPDCEARDLTGLRVGIEVTELVDEIANRDRRNRGLYRWAQWPPDRLLKDLQARISAKDDPAAIKGGPYDRYWIIIHSGEPALQLSFVEKVLNGHDFLSTRLIENGYLLLSYEPALQECPVIQLPLTRAL